MVMKIRDLREQAGITQTELAFRMGTNQNNVSNWETETALPRTRQLPFLACVLGVTIEDLFLPYDNILPPEGGVIHDAV